MQRHPFLCEPFSVAISHSRMRRMILVSVTTVMTSALQILDGIYKYIADCAQRYTKRAATVLSYHLAPIARASAAAAAHDRPDKVSASMRPVPATPANRCLALCRSWAGQNRATVATPRISQGIHARRGPDFTPKGDAPIPSYARNNIKDRCSMASRPVSTFFVSACFRRYYDPTGCPLCRQWALYEAVFPATPLESPISAESFTFPL